MAQIETRFFPDGDYPARLNRAYAAYEAAVKDEQENGEGQLLAHEQPASEVLKAEYEQLRAEALEDAEDKRRVVELTALTRRQWRPLKQAHPARVEGEGVDADTATGDRRAGVNVTSVEEDLVFATVTKPVFADRADFDKWADDLSEGEWATLVSDAWRLVNVAQFDPKALPPSLTASNGTS